MMRNRLRLCVMLLLAGMSAGQDRRDARDRFVGAWRLVRLERPGADGKLRNIDCTGMFIFTRDGHASVQVMERNPLESTPGGPEQYSQGGYEASWAHTRLTSVLARSHCTSMARWCARS